MLDIFDMWSASDYWWNNHIRWFSSWQWIVKQENPEFLEPWF